MFVEHAMDIFLTLSCSWVIGLLFYFLLKRQRVQSIERTGHDKSLPFIMIHLFLLLLLFIIPVIALVALLESYHLNVIELIQTHIYLEILVFVVFLLGLVYFINHFIQQLAQKYLYENVSDKSAVKALSFVTSGLKAIMIVVAILATLGAFGVDVGAAVAGLGLTGFALGFAFKDFLTSVISGILLTVYSPYKKNDRLKIGAFQGKVHRINLRYTYLRDGRNLILIPNSNVFNKEIIVEDHFPSE